MALRRTARHRRLARVNDENDSRPAPEEELTAGLPPPDDIAPDDPLPSGRRLSRDSRMLGLACVGLGVVLRTVQLGRREVFGDEFATLSAISTPALALWPSPESAMEPLLPLYHAAARWWMSFHDIAARPLSDLTPAGGIAGREWLLRVPSAVFGAAALAMFYRHAGRYLRGTAFVVAMVFAALNPTLVQAAMDATPVALLALAVVMAHHFGVRALDEGGRWPWLAWGVSTAVGLLAHPAFWALTASQCAFAAFRKKSPKPVAAGARIGLGLCAAVALQAGWLLSRRFTPNAPVIDDGLRGLVSAALGDFERHGTPQFTRAIMYLLVLLGLALALAFHRVRTLEASAVPSHVGFIDQTQDVVGTWRGLSLASYLGYQWTTCLGPVLLVMVAGGLNPRLHIGPAHLIPALPALAVLLGTGLDFIPRAGGKAIPGAMLVVLMGWYDFQTLRDPGYGVKRAFGTIREMKFAADRDMVVFSGTKSLAAPLGVYSSTAYPSIGVRTPETSAEATAARDRVTSATAGKARVFAILHDDLYEVEKRRFASGVRDALTPERGWTPVELKGGDRFRILSPWAGTELRVYTRR